MTTLPCPKCRLRMPDDALDRGQCPACGFPLDGPLVLDATTGSRRGVWWAAGATALIAGGAGYAAYAGAFDPTPVPHPPEAASAAPEPVRPATSVAPPPKPPEPAPPPLVPSTPNDLKPDPAGPKPTAPRPIGVVMKVDPRIAPTRHFDHPDDTAALPDLNTADRVTLTGRVRALRIGSVNGKGSIDASGLTAEEVVITGDLNGDAVVSLHAPNGKVTVGGYVGGAARLTVVAPGGELLVLANSGRVTGSSVVAVAAQRVDVAGRVSGGARLHATLTAGGALKLSFVEEGATVTYKKAAAADPPPAVEKGTVSGGAKVLAE